MLSTKQTGRLASGFVSLCLFAIGVGCNGFFVDPVLTAVAVGPQASIPQSGTVQMTAVGTYNDGSQKTLSSAVFWSSSATNTAIISPAGLVTGVSPGQSTISGSSGTVSGTTTITVTLEGLSSIQITPITAAVTAPTTQPYTAIGTASGKQFPLNGVGELSWTIDNTIRGLASIDNTGLVTIQSGVTTLQLIHVIATDPTTGIRSNTATLEVSPG